MEPNTPPYFNPFDPDFRDNPYPHYQRLLAAPPLKYSGPVSAVVISRYDDAETVLRDPETFSNHRPEQTPFRQLDLTGGAATMLGADPPVHTRLRKLVSRDFTPRRIATMAPRIEEITAALLDEAAASGRFDVIADLANQLPVMVIAEILGIPSKRHREFKAWSNAIIASSAVPPNLPRPPEAIEATLALRTFLADEIERRRHTPGPDLISALIASQEAEALTPGELLGFLILLLMAGNETTTNLIGNGVLALMRHQEQLERLRKDPDLVNSAIEGCCVLTARFKAPSGWPGTKQTCAAPTSSRERWLSCCWRPPIATHQGLSAPTRSISRATPTSISPSVREFTSAWARRWRGWKGRSRSAWRCRGSRASRWPTQRRRSLTKARCSCAAWHRCR
jgi:cytochrome P450